MALVLADRVRESSASTGTGTITLTGATFGYQSFSVVGDGNATYYTIYDASSGDWEVGIGTYTASGTTLSRTTVLSSSNAGALVPFGVGTKDVFVTYPSERSVYRDTANAYTVQQAFDALTANTAVIGTATLTAGTISTTPSAANDITNKTYVDSLVASGIHFHEPVRVESPINLNATYNNGTSGVGATLTNAGTQVALVIDGVTMVVNDRVLIYQQTTQTENGIYVVTDVGSGSTNWVLTRSADADTYVVASANGLSEGSTVFVQEGATGAGDTYTCNTSGVITFGTTNITFVQVATAQIYSAGTGLTLSGTQFSITNTSVSAATYGSASQVPVFAVNAQGQLTTVTNTSIAISSAAVSGLAPSATTDTTDAANITSGTLPSGRLIGGYTSVTGVGTLVAGTWNAGTIQVAYGGTGQTSYTDGQLLIGDTSTGGLTKATITAGTGVSVTNGNGSITIAADSGATTGIYINPSTISTNQTISSGTNGMSAGTITVANGITVTVANGSRWVVV